MSTYQLGCRLLQEQPYGTLRPIGCWFYSRNNTKRNFHATEQECHAVIWAITSRRLYIERTRFTIRTNHHALRWLMNLTQSSGRLTRWRLRLAELDFTIKYRPGRVHVVPDALSWLIARGEPLQTVKNKVTFFDGPLLLLRPHVTAEPVTINPTKVLKDTHYDHPGADDFRNEGVALVSTRAQRAQNGTGSFPASSSPTQMAPNCMEEFGEDCWDATDDGDQFEII